MEIALIAIASDIMERLARSQRKTFNGERAHTHKRDRNRQFQFIHLLIVLRQQ